MLQTLKTLLIAPAVLGGIGSAIVTFPISRVSAFFAALTTVVTAINELRVVNGGASQCMAEQPSVPTSGFGAFLMEKFRSPGFCPLAHAVCNCYAALTALIQLHFAKSFIMVVFAIAGVAVARIANLGYIPLHRHQSSLEKRGELAWRKLPHNLQVMLKDPGLLFCLGNVSLILVDLRFAELKGAGVASIVFFLGLCLAVVAVVRGIQPLLRSHAASASGDASLIGGVSDLLLGYSSFFYGNSFTAIGTIFWGLSNICLGARVGNTHCDRWIVMRWLRGER